jgi:tetratricopeptide (TPR) repeat protein
MELWRNPLANAERVRQLIDSAFARRYDDIPAMLRFASSAVVLAEEKIHELPVDLVVAAWTQYGNALRIAGQQEEAERALQRAASLPASDAPTRSHVLEVTANLYRNMGRFLEAEQLLTSALDVQRASGDSDAEGRIYNLLGINYFDSGQPARAAHSYQSALDRYTPATSPEAVTMTGHNLVEALIACGRLASAATLMTILEPSYRRITSGRLAAKVEWARARLLRELRQPSAAQLAFERAYEILSKEPRAPELAELSREMAQLKLFL